MIVFAAVLALLVLPLLCCAQEEGITMTLGNPPPYTFKCGDTIEVRWKYDNATYLCPKGLPGSANHIPVRVSIWQHERNMFFELEVIGYEYCSTGVFFWKVPNVLKSFYSEMVQHTPTLPYEISIEDQLDDSIYGDSPFFTIDCPVAPPVGGPTMNLATYTEQTYTELGCSLCKARRIEPRCDVGQQYYDSFCYPLSMPSRPSCSASTTVGCNCNGNSFCTPNASRFVKCDNGLCVFDQKLFPPIVTSMNVSARATRAPRTRFVQGEEDDETTTLVVVASTKGSSLSLSIIIIICVSAFVGVGLIGVFLLWLYVRQQANKRTRPLSTRLKPYENQHVTAPQLTVPDYQDDVSPSHTGTAPLGALNVGIVSARYEDLVGMPAFASPALAPVEYDPTEVAQRYEAAARNLPMTPQSPPVAALLPDVAPARRVTVVADVSPVRRATVLHAPSNPQNQFVDNNAMNMNNNNNNINVNFNNNLNMNNRNFSPNPLRPVTGAPAMSFICRECGKGYYYDTDLAEHMSKRHPSSAANFF